MELFLQAAALGIVTVIMGLVLSGRAPVYAALLSLCACCLVMAGLTEFIRPILSLLTRLRDLAQIDSQTTAVLLKAVGISLVAQLAELICQDGGQNALGKTICIMANSAIIWISLPIVEQLLTLVQEVLGKI